MTFRRLFHPCLLLAGLALLLPACRKAAVVPKVTPDSTATKDASKSPDNPAPEKPEATAKLLTPRSQFKPIVEEVESILLDSTGHRVLVGSGRPKKGHRSIQLWDLSSEPKKVRDYPGNLRAASAGLERFVRLHDDSPPEVVEVKTGNVVAKLPFPSNQFDQYHFRTPDALGVAQRKFVEKGKPDRMVVSEFDVRSKKLTELFEFPHEEGTFFRGAIKAGLEIVVARDKGARVEFWDVTTRKRSREVALAGFKTMSSLATTRVSEDGKWIADTSDGIRIYDASTGKVVTPAKYERIGPTFVPGRNLVLGFDTVLTFDKKATSRSGLWVYDLDKQTTTAFLPTTGGIAYSSDGRTAATWQSYKPTDVQIWDLSKLP